MATRCLSCDVSVADDKVCIVREVLICTDCNARVNEFLKLVVNDLRSMDRNSAAGIRVGLLTGEFRSVSLGTTLERVALLIRLVEKAKESPCPSPQTQDSSHRRSSSGESLPPHVRLLTAVGRKGSNSPTE